VKVTGWLFVLGCIFFFAVTGIYWWVTEEIIGTTALLLTGSMAILIGFYILLSTRRLGRLPEDEADAAIDEANPDYGFFSPHSWWPLTLAASAAMIFAGVVVASWIVVLGVLALLYSLIGLLFEYYRPSRA
jgi:hypothetical protein